MAENKNIVVRKSKKNRYFVFAFWLILVFGLVIRIIPAFGNNFYFTMDQALYAVTARNTISRGVVPVLGQPTSLPGVYNGPIWYWTITIFYFLCGGHPFGGNLMLILLNTILVGIIMNKLLKKTSATTALITGTILQFSWFFYDTSRYAFNPFPLVFLSFILIFLLMDFFGGDDKSFLWAGVPVALVVHTEVASFVPFLVFYFLVGIWGSHRKNIFKNLAGGTCVISLFFLPHLISELGSGFWQTASLIRHFTDPSSTFSGTQFGRMSLAFAQMISEGSIVQKTIPGLALFFILVALFILGKFKKNILRNDPFIDRFITLSISLIIISWIFFCTNLGWHGWQTVYVAPLILVSIILFLIRFPRIISVIGLVVVFLSQFLFFGQRYLEYLKPSNDQSILANELKAIDWVYQESGGKGFYVYNYLPSVLDYPYQYLFWWYGKGKYNYLPCEFSSYPGSPKIFIPGDKYYENPKRECINIRFLIVEPDKNTALRQMWLDDLRKGTILLKSATEGGILLEKRLKN